MIRLGFSKMSSEILKRVVIAFCAAGLVSGQAYADIVNTVTATGSFDGSPVTSPPATETVDVEDAAPQLSVAKASDVSAVNAAGDVIAYSVTVTNTGNVTVSSISVSDTLVSLVCPTNGDNTISSLAPGASEVCTANYSVLQADFDLGGANDGSSADGDIDNSASASGTYAGSPVSESDSHAVTLNVSNQLTTVKTSTLNEEISANGYADAGETVTYTYVISNTGNVTVTNVRVEDTHGGSDPLPTPADESLTTDNSPNLDSTDATANGVWDSLAPGDSVTFTATYTVTQTDVDTLQ